MSDLTETNPPPQLAFLVGSPRSGTSLLLTQVNRHPRIQLTYETGILANWPVTRKRGVRRDWRLRLDFLHGVTTRHGLPNAENATPGNKYDAALRFYHEYADAAAHVIGEKSPAYALCVEELHDAFPEARIVALWRSPEAICRSVQKASRVNHKFNRPGRFRYAMVFWDRYLRQFQTAQQRGARLFPVAYEQLTKNPESVLPAIWEFLQAGQKLALEDAPRADTSLLPYSEIHDNARKGAVLKDKPENDPLPPRVQRHLDRWVAYWHKHYPDAWPVVNVLPPAQAKPLSRFQRFLDEMLFQISRMRGALVLLIYGICPLSLAIRYRRLRKRHSYLTPERLRAHHS